MVVGVSVGSPGVCLAMWGMQGVEGGVSWVGIWSFEVVEGSGDMVVRCCWEGWGRVLWLRAGQGEKGVGMVV
jgi:hypothetical protein